MIIFSPNLKETSNLEKEIEPCIRVVGNYSPSGHEASRVLDPEGLAPTVKENHGTVYAIIEKTSIRKLTPSECFKLMGFTQADVQMLSANKISNTQLYKMAGNSIVVDVLMAIFKELYLK